jgi:hypothetical protein
MPKGKGKKKAATDSQKNYCIWSLDDEKKLMEYAVQHQAKRGDDINFTESF